MDNKVAIIGIFVQDLEASSKVNEILHEYSDCIIGRIGVPYKEKKVSIISVIVNATSDRISALSGKLGRIKGITAKSIQARIEKENRDEETD